MELTIRQIDLICTEFENSWHAGISPATLRSSVESHASPNSACFLRLACELLLIDMERRWLHLAHTLTSQFLSEPQAFAWLEFPFPRLESYHQVFSCLENSPGWTRLTECELVCRLRFGDAPPLTELAVPVSDWNRYTEHLPTVTRIDKFQTGPTFPFWNGLVIGRQAVAEPSPTTWLATPIQKLICAPLSDRQLSRHQMRINLVAGQVLKIENLSRNVQVALDGQRVVMPGQGIFLTFPFSLKFNSYELRFQRSAANTG